MTEHEPFWAAAATLGWPLAFALPPPPGTRFAVAQDAQSRDCRPTTIPGSGSVGRTRAVKLLTYAEGSMRFRLPDRLSDGDRAKLMGGTLSPIYNSKGMSADPEYAPRLRRAKDHRRER
jgi:hypothetical protein